MALPSSSLDFLPPVLMPFYTTPSSLEEWVRRSPTTNTWPHPGEPWTYKHAPYHTTRDLLGIFRASSAVMPQIFRCTDTNIHDECKIFSVNKPQKDRHRQKSYSNEVNLTVDGRVVVFKCDDNRNFPCACVMVLLCQVVDYSGSSIHVVDDIRFVPALVRRANKRVTT
ncbi:hypothetical protein VYU27_006587 [Nannochloropsis oceanica]